MGAVYRARDTRLGRDVAIKVLLAAVANDPERLARFQREAQVLASLNHPHIAAIYGIEDSGGTKALVLELVEGPTLADRLAPGALPLEDALPIAAQIAAALEAAHEQGIVHRDLKPANIKIRPDGTVKVLDFGLAKAIDPLISGSGPGLTSPTITTPLQMTGAGVILGTAAYMAPEQAKGRAVDRRADLWAFGAVLFEMIAGVRAFPGDDIAETYASVVKGDVDWDRLPHTTPAPVRALLRRCLRKDPRQRLADAGAARIEIEDALAAPPPAAAGPATPQRRGIPLSLAAPAALALVAAAAMLGAWLRPARQGQPRPVAHVVVPLPSGAEIARGASIAVSPDGTQIAYIALENGVTQLYLRRLD